MSAQILDHLTYGNYGPDGTLDIRWPWTARIVIFPGQRVLYRFSFSAWFENVVIVYSMPNLDLLIERGNYSRATDDFEITNNESHSIEQIITGWHKPSPPEARQPWLHSPKCDFPGTDTVKIIGFADDQGREQQVPRNPDLYKNGLVSVVYL